LAKIGKRRKENNFFGNNLRVRAKNCKDNCKYGFDSDVGNEKLPLK